MVVLIRYMNLAVVVIVVVAGEALCGVRGLTDGLVPFAFEHIAVTTHVFTVKGLNLVRRVRGLKGGSFDAEMEVAEIEIDVGGILVFAVIVLDDHSSGVGGKADARDVGVVVGLHVHGAEWSADLDVVSVGVFVRGHSAAGEEHARSRGENRQSKYVHRGDLSRELWPDDTPAHPKDTPTVAAMFRTDGSR